MSGVEDTPALPKAEHSREASSSSIASTPEPDAETFNQEHVQVQKRKGGRKPVSTRQPPDFLLLVVMLTFAGDLCDLRREEAEESSSSGRFPGAANGIYQAVGDDDQAS